MSTVPWQLIPVEDADLAPINLRLGATLLGRGQKASPGLDDDTLSRTVARMQVSTGRIQLTSMAHPGFLRINSADTSGVKQLARGQAALLATGDMVDLRSVAALGAPASRFTYMLAEYFPESDIQVQIPAKALCITTSSP